VQQREDAVVQMQVIREAVHQHDRRTVAGVVADMEAVPFERHRACLERTAGGHRTARGDDGGSDDGCDEHGNLATAEHPFLLEALWLRGDIAPLPVHRTLGW
jgi:hypothetical protein